MHVSITDISDVEKEIEIHATVEDLAPHFEDAYKRYRQKIEIRGFRKGKAPIHLIKKIHGESIEYDSLDTIASDFYRHVIEERDIHPIGEPVITKIDYKRGETLNFKIKYEVKPTIHLNEYKGIPIEKLVHKVNDKEVEEEILRLQKSNSTQEDAESVDGNEYIITADVQELDNSGTPLIGRKTTGVRFYLADETLFPELKEILRNARIGSIHRATITHEQDGERFIDHIEISVNKIEKVNLPEINDDFIKKITKNKIETVKDFQSQLLVDLESYWRDRTQRKLEEAIIGEIVRRHDVAVPESLVNGIIDSLLEDLKKRTPDKKLPKDFNEQSFRENNRSYAILQAKWYLIREHIIEKEKITVTEKEIEDITEINSQKTGIDKDRLRQFYKTSPAMRDRIISDKLMKFLEKHQRITEKVTEDFF